MTSRLTKVAGLDMRCKRRSRWFVMFRRAGISYKAVVEGGQVFRNSNAILRCGAIYLKTKERGGSEPTGDARR